MPNTLTNMACAALLGISSFIATGASAAPVGVDGIFSAGEYTSSVSVGYNPNVAFDFSIYNSANDAVAYDIYLKASQGYLYGFINPRPDVGGSVANIPGQFANLYFDLDPANGNGSDLGFSLGTNGPATAFIPASTDRPRRPGSSAAS